MFACPKLVKGKNKYLLLRKGSTSKICTYSFFSKKTLPWIVIAILISLCSSFLVSICIMYGVIFIWIKGRGSFLRKYGILFYKAWYIIETKIYFYEGTSSRCHISCSVMKLLIILTLCLGFVACSPRIRMVLLESGHAPMPQKAGKKDVLDH